MNSKSIRLNFDFPFIPGVIAFASVVTLLGSPAFVRAQETPPPPTARRRVYRQTEYLLKYLNTLNYDTTQYVPLIVVDPLQEFESESPMPDHPVSLATLSDAAHLRVVSTGNLNALVPLTMPVITKKLGKADLFAGMRRDELVKALASSLTAAQWRIIGSENGIGLGDLDENQRALWNDIFPAHLEVQKGTVQTISRLNSGSGPRIGSWTYTDRSTVAVTDRSAVRLRLSKQVAFMFSRKGTEDYGFFDDPYLHKPVDGQTELIINLAVGKQERAENSLYGVTLLKEEPNTDKPGTVDYASTSLDGRVNLHFAPKAATPNATEAPSVPDQSTTEDYGASKLPTVGDLIERINEATHLHFVADRRVRDLAVYLRGDSARAGDLLHGLARSICGTFRSVGPVAPNDPTLYLLTYDREGIGASIGRITEWADDAFVEKDAVLRKANAQTAKQNPLTALHFASDDRFAMTSQQAETAEDGWRKQQYAAAPEVKFDDLSPALKEAVLTRQEGLAESGTSVRTDRLRLGEELTTYLIIPGVGAVKEDQLGRSIGRQYLQEIAFDPTLSAPAAQPKPWKPPTTPFAWPANLTRRLLVAAPATPQEAESLVHAAHVRGFTDLWLQVSLADPPASGRILAAGVRAGAREHIAVGATVALLRDGGINGGMPGEPDRNVLGETGSEYAARKIATEHYPDTLTNPSFKEYIDRSFRRYANWITLPDAPAIAERLAPIAAVPGLTALTLRDTAAPGWNPGRDSDGIRTDGHLGYALATRRAFLDKFGVDPIDVTETSNPVPTIRWNLGYFAAEADETTHYRMVNGQRDLSPVPVKAIEKPHLALSNFLAMSDSDLLRELYISIRHSHPDLPLYLDDRKSPYTDVDHSWFGSWDAADRLPINPSFTGDSEVQASAHSHSKTLITIWGTWMRRHPGTPEDTPLNFAGRLSDVVNSSHLPARDAVAIDLPLLPAKEVLHLLTGLPPVQASQQVQTVQTVAAH